MTGSAFCASGLAAVNGKRQAGQVTCVEPADLLLLSADGVNMLGACSRMRDQLQVYPQGKMSQCMERLNIGDTLRFKGPRGKFKYQPNMKKAIGELSMSASVSFAATIRKWGSVRISIVWHQGSRCVNRLTSRAASSSEAGV